MSKSFTNTSVVPPETPVADSSDPRERCPKCGRTKWTLIDGVIACSYPGCHSPLPRIPNVNSVDLFYEDNDGLEHLIQTIPIDTLSDLNLSDERVRR